VSEFELVLLLLETRILESDSATTSDTTRLVVYAATSPFSGLGKLEDGRGSKDDFLFHDSRPGHSEA
jgi:hypothetical protein